MNNEFTLRISGLKHSQSYVVESAMRMLMGEKFVEMVETAEISISLVSYTPGQRQFYCKQTAYKQQSTNETFFEVARIINSYLDEIYITIDDSGHIIKVRVPDAAPKWQSLQQQLRRKYGKNEGVEDMLRQSAAFIQDESRVVAQLNSTGYHKLFFSGHYGTYTVGEPVQGEDKIEKLVAGIDVPLVLTKELSLSRLANNDIAPTLTIEGSLNEQIFDRPGLVRWLKDVTDTYNLKVSYTLEMEEHYTYNNLHWLTDADSYFSFIITNIYSYSFARTIKQKSTEQQNMSKWKMLDV